MGSRWPTGCHRVRADDFSVRTAMPRVFLHLRGTNPTPQMERDRGWKIPATSGANSGPEFYCRRWTTHLPIHSLKNAMVFTPEMSNLFRQRRFLHATLSSSSTM